MKIDPSVDMKTPPKIQVDTMPAAKYFTYAAELLKLHPPHLTDQPIIAQMKRIGIEPGKSFDFDKLDPVVQQALTSAPEEAQELMTWKVATLARVANGWSMNTDTMGVYGNYYLKRAIVAQVGLGANLPEDAIYPLNLADDTGKPLDGANKYSIHFDKGDTPPAERLLVHHALRLPKASRSATCSIALRSAVGCRSRPMRMGLWTSISKTRVPAKTRKPTGCPRRRGHST